jgi:hypothetical protein
VSGGSFDYAFCRVSQFSDELAVKLDENEKPDEYGHSENLGPAVVAKLRNIEALARRCSALMREAEWLYSGDTGEESFLGRVAEIEEEPCGL